MKTRLRILRTGAREFRWTAELCPPRCVRVRAWGNGKNGCMLRVDLMTTGDTGRWFDDPDTPYPTPGIVRVVIDYALAHGWDPSSLGGRYVLSTDAELEVPGFQITDILEGFQHLRQ
jgi:hypothetical protein